MTKIQSCPRCFRNLKEFPPPNKGVYKDSLYCPSCRDIFPKEKNENTPNTPLTDTIILSDN